MNRNLLLVVGAIILLAAGYFLFLNRPPQPALETVEEAVTPSEEFTVTLAEQNESGETGVATLVEENGSVKVTLSLTGVPEGISQPVHIHAGACPDVGAVVYPLNNVVDGDSETTLDVTMEQLRAGMPLAINVHKSVKESGVYVSCGDLTL